MTFEELVGDLTLHADTGRLPGHARWFRRASAVVQLEPARCAQLASLVELPSMSANARGLVLDLLAAAGTPEAQAALRAALSSRTVREDAAGFIAHVQRLSLVAKPDAETLSFARGEYERARADRDPERRIAATYALGAVIGRRAGGDAEGARREAERLRTELRRADKPEERRVLLRALGNAALPKDAATVRSYLSDDDPEVRAAAASALGAQEGPEQVDGVIEMLGDAEPIVQAAALSALAEHELTAAQLARVAGFAPAIAHMNDRALVALLIRYGAAAPVAHTALELVLARSHHDRMFAAQLRRLLGEG
jgi:HEAT repeat protein